MPSRERRARPTEHNKPLNVIQHMAEAYPAKLFKTIYYLIMGQIVRHDEDHTDNCSREKSRLIS